MIGISIFVSEKLEGKKAQKLLAPRKMEKLLCTWHSIKRFLETDTRHGRVMLDAGEEVKA